MAVRQNHNRNSNSLKIVTIENKEYQIFTGEFSTNQIRNNMIAKMKKGTVDFDKNQKAFVVHQGIFEPAYLKTINI